MTINEIKVKVNQINISLKKDYDFTERPEKSKSQEFNRKFSSMLKQIFGDEYQIIPTKGTWCSASGFIKYENNFVYYSTNDYRYKILGEWYERILIRTAESEKDYRGGSNYFADIYDIKEKVDFLFKKQ